jgi:hypothetical protein
MKLSEAIRLGSMLKPQAFNELAADGKTCALGAAYEAVGMAIDARWGTQEEIQQRKARIRAEFPLIYQSDLAFVAPCGCLGGTLHFTDVGAAIIHLNDHHRWSREQIADWVATIEPQEAAEDVSRAWAPVSVATRQS